MKKGRMHACIWLSLIAFAVLSLIAVIKAFTEKPFRIELLLGIIGRFMGTFLCCIYSNRSAQLCVCIFLSQYPS